MERDGEWSGTEIGSRTPIGNDTSDGRRNVKQNVNDNQMVTSVNEQYEHSLFIFKFLKGSIEILITFVKIISN